MSNVSGAGVESAVHPSSWRDHRLDPGRAHPPCTNCCTALGSVDSPLVQRGRHTLGSYLRTLRTTVETHCINCSQLQFGFVILHVWLCRSWAGRGSASRSASPERDAPICTTRHASSSFNSFSRLVLNHRMRCIFTMRTRPCGHSNQLPYCVKIGHTPTSCKPSVAQLKPHVECDRGSWLGLQFERGDACPSCCQSLSSCRFHYRTHRPNCTLCFMSDS